MAGELGLGGAISGIIGTGVAGMNIEDENYNKYLIDQLDQERRQLSNSLKINPLDYQVQYDTYGDPLTYDTYLMSDTTYNDIALDPNVLSAQNKALDELINLSEAKGLNAIDQQALQEIVNEENRNLQAQNDRILQDAMQRGVYGSGLEMAQRLQAAQSGANRMNNRDMEVMSQAQQRALDALSSYGNLAGNMRTQDYNEQSQKAKAQDAINQFNVNQQTEANKGNVNNFNQTAQDNVKIKNAQQDKNLEGTNTLFSNRLQKANFEYGGGKDNLQSNIDHSGRQMSNVNAWAEGVSSLWN